MSSAAFNPRPRNLGSVVVVPFAHPQGCRSYVVADPTSKQALAIDVHLDLVSSVETVVRQNEWTLPYVVDTHTHADHPSGAGELARRFSSTRIGHRKANHQGVTRHPEDGEIIHLGDQSVVVRHTPGHTPDHMVLECGGAIFSGDTLLIGNIARTDFLGGDAGQLFDSLRTLLTSLPDDTVLFPGHDYEGRVESTVGQERKSNPWLQIEDRVEFVRALTANPPPEPANMQDLLRLNREGVDIPSEISAAEAAKQVKDGGAGRIIDVRTDAEVDSERIPGTRHIPMDQLGARADEVRATPAPRLLLCRTGSRATVAQRTLGELGVAGLSVVAGGIEAFRSAGGDTVRGAQRVSLERQVRIGAGALGLCGVVLGFVAHWSFFLLSGFVSAGLLFAGLTDWCGMGLLLAKMPWNRARKASTTAPLAGCAATAPGAVCAATPPSPEGTCAATPPAAAHQLESGQG